jgi:hypothetical protein
LQRLLRTHRDIDGLDTGPGAPGQYDWQAPLLELPRIFNTLVDTIPARVPYLVADEAVTAWWAETLGPVENELRVGVAWRGSPDHRNDHRRSIDARQLSVLAGTPNARFIPLQKEYPAGDPEAGLDWEPLPRPLTDFADTAALMMNLDLIVSVDTAVAHLAGALARPVWTLLPRAPDWRWLLDREDSPWYPTMRLFRQSERGDWAGVLMRVGEELANMVKPGREPLGSSP